MTLLASQVNPVLLKALTAASLDALSATTEFWPTAISPAIVFSVRAAADMKEASAMVEPSCHAGSRKTLEPAALLNSATWSSPALVGVPMLTCAFSAMANVSADSEASVTFIVPLTVMSVAVATLVVAELLIFTVASPLMRSDSASPVMASSPLAMIPTVPLLMVNSLSVEFGSR